MLERGAHVLSTAVYALCVALIGSPDLGPVVTGYLVEGATDTGGPWAPLLTTQATRAQVADPAARHLRG